ncbi:lactosylceramide 4-alpha-galactosyltransferase-like [Dermacentor albipictus]|uniref:lactosylceramide 4-alpha-galactosyltransferase-like n=1 Tax=Dermacentor albipictus TaxID=60249 RepID=UPI0038FCFC1A
MIILVTVNWSTMVLEDATFLNEGGDRAPRRIFFLETSRIRTVGARTACAVESASRLHPLWSVHYLHASVRVLSPFCPFATLLRTFRNVRLAHLDYKSHFKDTVLDLWLREAPYKRGPYEAVHLSDGLRLGLLFKHGGVYADFDVIFLKSLEGIDDAVVACSADDTVTNNFLAFSARHSFIRDCLDDFVWGYYPKDWGYNGPRVVRRVLLRWCNATRVEQALDNRRRCRGVTVLPRNRLLPLNYTTAHQLFHAAAGPSVSESFGRSYLVHTFHSRTRGIQAERGSFVERAAAENCPRTFELANRLYGRF